MEKMDYSIISDITGETVAQFADDKLALLTLDLLRQQDWEVGGDGHYDYCLVFGPDGEMLPGQSEGIGITAKKNGVDIGVSLPLDKFGSYLFIRLHEAGPDIHLAKSLDGFISFCHYANLTNPGTLANNLPGEREGHKQEILKSIKKTGSYTLLGNDVVYMVIQHYSWALEDPKNKGTPVIPFGNLKIKIEKYGEGWGDLDNKERSAIKDVIKDGGQ